MSEALTPHLSREEYVRLYIQNIQAEEANAAFNFAANQQYQANGETLGQLADQSKTLTGVPIAQLRAQVAQRLRGVVLNSDAAVGMLSDDELRFASTAMAQIINVIERTYQVPLETLMLKQIVQALIRQNPPQYNRANDPQALGGNPPGVPPPQPGAGGPPQQPGAGAGLKPKRKPIMQGRGLLAPVGPKHYIEVGCLRDGFVSLRNGSGKQIEKKVKIGGNVGNAIKNVLEGKAISYEDAETMNDDERSYMNHLAKKTGEQGLHMRLREKTKAEQLEHTFEILKGQIEAGNDSPELLKEFKKVILQLRRMHKLSKPQVGDILLEIATYE